MPHFIGNDKANHPINEGETPQANCFQLLFY